MVLCLAICCVVCIPCCCCVGFRKSQTLQNYLYTRRTPSTKMGILVGCGKQILWIITRLLFNLFRAVIWLVLMRHCRILVNYRKGAYKQTAHVQRILLRHKFDHMIQPARASNFLTMHKCFKDPEYVLRRNVSLYCLTKTEAVFVECDCNINVNSSDISSFVRIAQFKHAKNIIVIPMHVFLKLAEHVGSYSGKLVFIANTGRCGSTLLTQVFEETKESVAISEPDAMNALNSLSSQLPPEEFNALVRATVNMLCKNPESHIKSYVIKLAQTNLQLMPYLASLFPESRNLFMYRDGITVAKSVAKVVNGTPLASMLVKLARNCTCIKIGRIICDKANLPISDFDSFDSLYSPMFVGTIMWASGIKQYLDFRKDGIEIAAVRYEDMVSDTNYALEKIFLWCQMKVNLEAVDKAFSRDSQRGSPISRSKLKQLDNVEITEVVREQTDYACQVFNVPSIYKTCIVDNTISYRSITSGTEGLKLTTHHIEEEVVNINNNSIQIDFSEGLMDSNPVKVHGLLQKGDGHISENGLPVLDKSKLKGQTKVDLVNELQVNVNKEVLHL